MMSTASSRCIATGSDYALKRSLSSQRTPPPVVVMIPSTESSASEDSISTPRYTSTDNDCVLMFLVSQQPASTLAQNYSSGTSFPITRPTPMISMTPLCQRKYAKGRFSSSIGEARVLSESLLNIPKKRCNTAYSIADWRTRISCENCFRDWQHLFLYHHGDRDNG